MPEQNVFSDLTRLQEEMERLSTAVNEIDKAKNTAVSVVQNGKSLYDQYDIQNKKIETTHNDIIEQVKQLKKLISFLESVDFPKRFDKVDSTINDLWLDAHTRLKFIQNLLYALIAICSLSLILSLVALIS